MPAGTAPAGRVIADGIVRDEAMFRAHPRFDKRIAAGRGLARILVAPPRNRRPAMADDTAIARGTSENERMLLDVARRYLDAYNHDVDRLVLEVYAHDVDLYMTGGEIHGKDQFLAVERAILAAAPQRRMRIDRTLICGSDTIVLEAVILDDARPEFFSPLCVILTVRDGRIVRDHSYLEPARWPGIEAAIPFASPGGLGAPR
jgi:ketosteroid isomerase-like protein